MSWACCESSGSTPVHLDVLMKYDQPEPLTRAELESQLDSGGQGIICKALISTALYESDRSYVESLILERARGVHGLRLVQGAMIDTC
jgi:hypothetical protein